MNWYTKFTKHVPIKCLCLLALPSWVSSRTLLFLLTCTLGKAPDKPHFNQIPKGKLDFRFLFLREHLFSDDRIPPFYTTFASAVFYRVWQGRKRFTTSLRPGFGHESRLGCFHVFFLFLSLL